MPQSTERIGHRLERRNGTTVTRATADDASGSSEPLSAAAIARQATRGARTYVLRVGLTQLLQAISALAVARAVLPSEYGLFALALTMTGAARFLGDLGVSYYLVVERQISDRQLRAALTVGFAVAIIGAAVVAAVWPLLAVVQDGPPNAELIGPILAITLLLQPSRAVAAVELQRGLAFSALGRVTIAETAILFGTQIAMLLAGAGFWAIVVAQVVGAAVGCAGTLYAAGRVLLPTFSAPFGSLIRRGLPYQAVLISTGAVGLFVPVLVTALLGARANGLLAWATILASPFLSVVTAIHNVATPTLARMGRDAELSVEKTSETVLLTLALVAAAAAGVCFGLTDDLIRELFTDRWSDAAGAVRAALIGLIPTAVLLATASVTDARLEPGKRLQATIAGGIAAACSAVPLALAFDITGAAVAAYVIDPLVAMTLLTRIAGVPLGAVVWRAALVFGGLAVVSTVLGEIVDTLAGVVVAGVFMTLVAFAAVRLAAPEIPARILMYLRREKQPA